MKTCKICGDNTYKYFEEKSTYYKCKKCDFIFLDEKKYLEFKEEKYRYSLHNNTLNNIGYVKMFLEFINKSVFPYSNTKFSFFDFGCGNTPVLSLLLKKFFDKVYYYDPYFFDNKNLLSRKYDFITSTEVFEHFYTPNISLNLLSNLLKKNGIMSIMTLFPPDNIENFSKWYYKKDPTHVCFYSLKTFEKIAEIYNFKIIYSNKKNICVLKKL